MEARKQSAFSLNSADIEAPTRISISNTKIYAYNLLFWRFSVHKFRTLLMLFFSFLIKDSFAVFECALLSSARASFESWSCFLHD